MFKKEKLKRGNSINCYTGLKTNMLLMRSITLDGDSGFDLTH